MSERTKFKTGDFIIRVKTWDSAYAKHFTFDREYEVLSAEVCGKTSAFDYVLNDIGIYVLLHEHHFIISPRHQRNEIIKDILS